MRPVALALLLSLPAPLGAETVTIRSGEHADYTRLVLTIPDDAEWQIGTIDSGYRAEFGAPVSAIDTSRVFDRVPRDRLADLQAEEARLDLVVGCDCHLDAFLFRPDMLVIDIIDGPAPEDSPFEGTATIETLVEPSDEAEEASAEAMVLPVPETTLTNAATLATQSAALTPVQLPLFTEAAPWTDTLSTTSPHFTPVAPRDPNIVEAERAILESFARAATQGVFDFPARPLPPPPEEGEEAAASQIAPMTDPMDGVAIPLMATDPAGPGLLLRTGIDRDAMDGTDENTGPDSCPEGIEHDLTRWGEPGEFGTLIPELRLAAADEIGNPVPEAVLRLARAYIYYGFGLEARRVLETLGPPDEQARYLTAIAHLVDGDPLNVRTLLPYRGCGETMEAWIVLASGRLDTSDQRIKSAILISARALPDSLRGHLGIRLAQIFAEAGDLHNAQEILSGSISAITGEDRDLDLAAADLAGRTEGAEAEVAHLDRLIERDPRAAPEDMVRLLDLARETDAEIDEDILEIAETMRFEANGTEPEARLVEAEVLFQLDLGNYGAAFELLDGDVGPMSDERLSALRSSAMIALTEQADDGEFLDFAFSGEVSSANHLAEHAIAARLLDLDFAEQAFVLIGAPITGPLRDERLALQSRAAETLAALDQLDQTLDVAMPDAQDGDPTAQAMDTDPVPHLAEGEEGSPLDGAWRAGAWEVLEQSDDPLLSSASRALLSPAVPPGEETPIADTRALLDQAREAREIADGLLTRFTIDDSLSDDGP